MILLVTNEQDLTSDYVVLELQKRGLQFERLNTERISKYRIFCRPTETSGWCVSCDLYTLRFRDVTAGYFRRPGKPAVPVGVRSAYAQYCVTEWNLALAAALQSINDRWFNSPSAIAAAEIKPAQLALASGLGLSVPETIVTNTFDQACEFVRRGPTVGKPLKEALIGETAEERVIFTTRLTLDYLTSLPKDAFSAAPLILQREILKASDIRVTIVGDRVFSTEIDSQRHLETETDWRKGCYTDLPHSCHELPVLVADRCRALVKTLGLRFGAIDLIKDRDGQYWFLEINPNGQWAWIENRTEQPITQAIVDELQKIAG